LARHRSELAIHKHRTGKGTRGKPRARQSGGKPPHSKMGQARMRCAYATDEIVGSTLCQGFSSGFFVSFAFPMTCWV